MNNYQLNGESRDGMVAGSIVSLLAAIQMSDLAHAAIIAATGTAVSFFVSLGLRYASKKLKGPG